MTLPFARRTGGAVLSIAVCTVVLAACGGGSSSGGTSNASSTTTNGAAAAGGPGGGRFAALRTCLAQNGITLPARPARPAGTPGPAPGAGRGGGGLGLGLGGGGGGGGAGRGLARRLPAGVTAAQFAAALKKCGGGAGAGGAGFGARRLQTPAAKAALAKFVTCMQGKGVKLPAANTTGTGPVFNTKGINTTTAPFKAAYAACQPLLASVFPRRAAGAGGSTTATPSPPAPSAQ